MRTKHVGKTRVGLWGSRRSGMSQMISELTSCSTVWFGDKPR